jgi:hypothetical protein
VDAFSAESHRRAYNTANAGLHAEIIDHTR